MGQVKVSQILWDTAIIGRGTAASAYLASMGPRPCELIVAIGEADPWSPQADKTPLGRGHAGAPGDPTLALNQSEYLLRHFGSKVPISDRTNMDRYAFAKHNAEILATHTDKQVDHKVIGIRFGVVSDKLFFPDTLINGYIIKYLGKHGDEKELYARNVVVTGGAGTHRFPSETDVANLRTVKLQRRDYVLDVNEFAKLTATQLTGKTVCVIGPNAAIDAVQKALHKGYDCKVVWIVGAKQKPAILDSQETVLAARDRITFRYDGTPRAEPGSGNTIKIVIKAAQTEKANDAFRNAKAAFLMQTIACNKNASIHVDNSDPMNSEVNFTTYDANMMHAYIIINFPLVSEADANEFVRKVVLERKALIQHTPVQVTALRAELESKQRNEEAKILRQFGFA